MGIFTVGRIIHCRPYYQPTSLRSKQATSNRDRGIARLKVLQEKGKEMIVCNFKTDYRGQISKQFYRGKTGIVTLSWFSRKIFMTVLSELRKTGKTFMDDLRGIFCCNGTTRNVLGQLWTPCVTGNIVIISSEALSVSPWEYLVIHTLIIKPLHDTKVHMQ